MKGMVRKIRNVVGWDIEASIVAALDVWAAVVEAG